MGKVTSETEDSQKIATASKEPKHLSQMKLVYTAFHGLRDTMQAPHLTAEKN